MSDEVLHAEADATLKRLTEKHKELSQELRKARAFAVFPALGRAGLVLGGAYGRGEVYERGRSIGFARLTQMTLGVQVGGQTFSEIVMFQDDEALKKFKEGLVVFNANASAVIVKAGGSGTINIDGIVAHAYTRGGLLLEASLGGQKLTYVPPQANAGSTEKRGLFRRGRSEEEGSEESEQEENGSEQEEPDEEPWREASATTDAIASHPMAMLMIAPSISFAATMLARKLLSSAGGSAGPT